MTFDWNNLIPLAKYLENKCTDLNSEECIDLEATYRTIINRSYYAAYNVAKKFARREFTTISKRGSEHESLIKMFKSFRHENGVYSQIASKLDRIKNNRISADYFHNFGTSSVGAAASTSLSESQKIIEIIGNIENQPVS